MIRPEYWIECHYCGQEIVMVETVPSTGCDPKTKGEAWEAAKSVGWTGNIKLSKCPECSEK